ncbi:MAG TPA: diacylglycerol kinase family protein, partial [Gammaproteobacteria bacterium]|nr:diacylglycerol kinase family protein [Gammaproteobacteria bacterium]
MRALLLINQDSRQGQENTEAAARQLEALDVAVIKGRFEQPKDVSTSIEQYAQDVDCIIVGGGDGTINLAAGAVMRNGLPLAVLPLGTANDFARTLLIDDDLETA